MENRPGGEWLQLRGEEEGWAALAQASIRGLAWEATVGAWQAHGAALKGASDPVEEEEEAKALWQVEEEPNLR